MVFHQKLLEANTIKSLTAGEYITLVSTGEFVSISAEGATSADGPAGTFPLVNGEGAIRRLRPGAGAYAVTQDGLGSVELGVQLQAAQFQAPIAVMDQTNATALRARLGETRAEFFTDVEVNGAADVSGILSAWQLRSEGIVQVGVNPPAGATVAIDGTLRATGNVSTSAALRADSLAPLTGTVVTATDDLTVTGTTRCDVFKGRQASEVTCQDNLTVTGVLECQGNVSSTGQVAAQSVFCKTDLTVLGNIFGWFPYFCAGRVNGVTGAPGTSIGRVGYSVWRPGTQPTGVYEIRFDTPAPSNNYVLTLACMTFGATYLWDANPPTANGFHCVVVSNAWQLRNAIFHFSVTL
jgi:hypothetical protein